MHHATRRTVRFARAPIAFIAAVLLFGAAAPVDAQARSGSDKPADGDWSLMFTLFEPDALTNFGLFRMVGDRLNVGLEVELEWADGEQQIDQQQGLQTRSTATDWRVLFGPSVRWYGSRIGPVSPYLRGKVAMGKGAFHLDVNEERRREEERADYQASLGIGAEWHPFAALGIAGHTGLQWARTETEITDRNSANAELMNQNIRTFRSGIVVNFYFR